MTNTYIYTQYFVIMVISLIYICRVVLPVSSVCEESKEN